MEHTPVVPRLPPRRETRAPTPAPPSRAAAPPAPERPTGIADPTFFAARQLDVYPAPESPIELRYPAAARASDVKGRVLVLVLIDASGTVVEVSVVEAEPAGYFENEARRTLQSVRFRPALKDGRAVNSRILVSFNYGSESSAPWSLERPPVTSRESASQSLAQ